MPQPQARGNSAMAKFDPSMSRAWQLDNRCGMCGHGFGYLNPRHHCRSCGMSVCGKHSRNKVVIPSSLSKVPQRVCDHCYPTCMRGGVAKGAGAARSDARAASAQARPRRDASPRSRRRHTLEPRPSRERDRTRSPRGGSRMRQMDSPRRDNRTWNGDDDCDERRRIAKRPVQSARERPRESGGRDQSRESRPVSSRERRIMSPHASPAQKERRRLANDDPLRQRKQDRMRSPAPSLGKRGSSKPSEPSTCRTEASSTTLSHLYADLNAEKHREKTSVKKAHHRPRKEKEEEERRDSSFSIFSLTSGPGDVDPFDGPSAAQAQKVKERKKKEEPAPRRPQKSRAVNGTRPSLEKKKELDFGASSSSVTSFEVSAITQKYLKAPPKMEPMQTDLKPMEEDEEESTRSAKPLTSARHRSPVPPPKARKHDNKIRGAYPSSRALPPFRQRRDPHKNDDLHEFRSSSELGNSLKSYGDRKPSQNSGDKSSRTSSISDDEELKRDQGSLRSGKCFSDDECFSDPDDETLANLISASNRASRELTVKARAKRADIAGIGPAFKEPTKPTYQLTKRDRDVMQQMSELEVQVLKQQKELPVLLEKYRQATQRAEKAKLELRESRARVLRYEKAHAVVSRAIRTGRLYMQQKEYMAAILELMRATSIEKSNATLWYMLAECRLKISQPAAAEDACMTSLNLQPTAAGVALLGRILYERGRHDEAIECYLSALGRSEDVDDE